MSTLAPEPTVRHSLSWYVDRLNAGAPTVSLLYGDGEFLAADPANVGRGLQNGEVVTTALCREIRESLATSADGPDLVRGADPFVLDWKCYGGQDVAWVKQSSEAAGQVIADCRKEPVEWVDGRIWDDAVRAGELGPLVRWINRTPCVVVCNPNVLKKPFPWHPNTEFVTVPKCNAAADLEVTWQSLTRFSDRRTFLLCCGLTAIPLAMRLRSAFRGVTALDLGSTLDVFFDLGRERGWRDAIYNDSTALKALRRANLGGLA